MTHHHPGDPEDRYFMQLEAERRAAHREELERRAHELEALGTDDAEVATRIRALGFDPETAAAFFLLPLVHVAWADGEINRGERAEIFRALEARGEPHDGPAAKMLATLLEASPGASWMKRSLELLEQVTGSKLGSEDLLERCTRVAEASGGFLGLVGDPVSAPEREVIAQIANSLTKK